MCAQYAPNRRILSRAKFSQFWCRWPPHRCGRLPAGDGVPEILWPPGPAWGGYSAHRRDEKNSVIVDLTYNDAYYVNLPLGDTAGARFFREYLFQIAVGVAVAVTVASFAVVNKVWSWPNAIVAAMVLMSTSFYLMEKLGIGRPQVADSRLVRWFWLQRANHSRRERGSLHNDG